MPTIILDRLTPEGKKFYAELAKLTDLRLKVGFQAGHAAEEDGTDICDIAAWNELGTSTIPSRPFLAQSVDDNISEITSFCQYALGEIASGAGTAESALKKIGAFQVGKVQETITDGGFAPNAPSTIRQKGSAQPLIDTGTMRQSVHYFITGKGDE